MRMFLVPVLVTLAAGSAAAADRTRPAVPLAIDGRGGITVGVRVNGHGPFKFILDTGASRSIVSDDLARDLGAPVVAKSEVVTSAGSDMSLVVRLTSVELASARADALLAPVIPAARLSQIGHGIRGLLGQDFLSAFNYTLDYRRGRLTWDDAVSCDAAGAVRMTAAEGRFVMALQDRRGGALRLVPDSGAEVAVLFSGRLPLPDVARVRVGSVTLRDLRVVTVTRDDPNADGLLPLHGFAAVSFAAGGSCLIARAENP
jgi:predicted aspartyl protease